LQTNERKTQQSSTQLKILKIPILGFQKIKRRLNTDGFETYLNWWRQDAPNTQNTREDRKNIWGGRNQRVRKSGSGIIAKNGEKMKVMGLKPEFSRLDAKRKRQDMK
jgi:hypothetical protein